MLDFDNASCSQPPVRAVQHVRQWLRLWFGISDRVSPKAYAASGFSLMLCKYAVDAGIIFLCTGEVLPPWDFLNPSLSARQPLLQAGPSWLPWALFVWTLPFLWIAVTMSVRRAADAGNSPWLGLLVLIPILNLLVMLVLCVRPSAPRETWMPAGDLDTEEHRGRSAALAVGFSLILGGLMLWLSVYIFSSYGASLFLGTPLLMGTSAGYIYNRQRPRSGLSSVMVGLISVVCAEGALLMVALEGLLCLAMAAPLLWPIGALGGLIGKAIADSTRRPRTDLMAAIVVLPLLAGLESLWSKSPEHMVLSSIEIDAPPATVWTNVVDFPDLPAARPWYFSWGIACPERAWIDGAGRGAIRYCEFTTGSFVEPITTWDPPRRLAFDVTRQPDPLVELSPYRHIHPPHMRGYLRSTRGEFHLVPLAEGRTRLEGRTWYRFQMFPQWYWTLWSDRFIHEIHERVLGHIKAISEAPPARQ